MWVFGAPFSGPFKQTNVECLMPSKGPNLLVHLPSGYRPAIVALRVWAHRSGRKLRSSESLLQDGQRAYV